MNMAECSIRIFPKWERRTVENGVQIFWLTLIRATPTGEYKNQKKNKLVFNEFFVVRILYIYRHRPLFDTIYRN